MSPLGSAAPHTTHAAPLVPFDCSTIGVPPPLGDDSARTRGGSPQTAGYLR
jgi:hypothetical protein